MLRIKSTLFVFLEILHNFTGSKRFLSKMIISQRQIYESVGIDICHPLWLSSQHLGRKEISTSWRYIQHRGMELFYFAH